MSKRSERREAERLSRKQAYQQLRQQRAQQTPVEVTTPASPSNEANIQEDLLAKAQAFFQTETLVAEPVAEPSPLSQAQLAANRQNAQHSTGPVTAAGKSTVSQNRRTHGLTGQFKVLPWEDASAFQSLVESVYAEHNPQSDLETRLTESTIQHYWLKERAVQLQEHLLAEAEDPTNVDGKKLALFLRYQTTHERSYYKAQKELLNLQKSRRQQQNGFESQNQKQEAHQARVRLANARAQNLEIDTACRQVMEVPIRGNQTLSFEELTKACTTSIAAAIYQKHHAAKG